jgi:glycosyltransferase involved in cell wall biosynthesis
MAKSKNILVVTGWSFNDALVQTYTLPYVKIIKKNLPENSKIYLFTQRQKSYYIDFEKNETTKKELELENVFVIEQKYYPFGIKAILSSLIHLTKLILLIFQKRITTIHAWCTPAGTIAYILSVITRKPLVIDSYEPHAEAMVENGTWNKKGLAFKLLFFFEKLQSKRAKVCIGLTEKTPEYAKKTYGIKPKKHYVKPACVDLNIFNHNIKPNYALINEAENTNKIIAVYAGKIGGIYLEKEIFEFFKACEEYWRGDFKAIILSNSPKEIIENYIKDVSINPNCIWHKKVSHSEVNNYMALADFALNPVKPVPTKRYCTSIKDGEYWAMGLPVVITPNISDDSDIIKENNIGSVITELNKNGYLKSIKEIEDLLKENSKTQLKEKIRNVAKKYRDYSIAEKIYSEIYR